MCLRTVTPSALLARIQQALRVEETLQATLEIERDRIQLKRQVTPLGPTDAVLGGDRAAQFDDGLEQQVRCPFGGFEGAVASGIEDEGRMQIGVACMPPPAVIEASRRGDLGAQLEESVKTSEARLLCQAS